MKIETTVETVAEFTATQVIIPEWMQASIRVAGPDGQVRVRRNYTPVGTFVAGISPVIGDPI